METLKDIWATLVAGVRDRTTNPLTLSFLVSWSLWNYKFFVILFEDTDSGARLRAIATMYPHESATYLGEALLYPLISALAYVFIYPVVSLAPIGAYRIYQVWTANLVKKIEKSRVLTQAEAIALTRRHEKEKTVLEEEMTSRATELNELRNALKETEEEISKLRASLPPKQPPIASDKNEGLRLPSSAPDPNFTLSKSQAEEPKGESLARLEERLVLLLSNQSNSASTKAIADAVKSNYSLIEAELKNLATKALVKGASRTGYTGTFWSLTSIGKELAVKLLREKSPQ